MANSVDPDQTAPIGAVCSGSTLFASILSLSVMLGNFFAADDFSRRHFQMNFFLGALRFKSLSTAMVMSGWLVHLTTLFSLASLTKRLTSASCIYFGM